MKNGMRWEDRYKDNATRDRFRAQRSEPEKLYTWYEMYGAPIKDQPKRGYGGLLLKDQS